MHYGQDFMRAVDERHRLYDYNTNFWELTACMHIPVVEGCYNSAVYIPAPLITLRPEVYYGDWSFTRFHELAHTVLRDSGIEAQLWADAEYPEQFRSWVEAYCNFGAAQFQIPNHQLRRVLGVFGQSPRAVVKLAEQPGVDLFDAMQRVALGFLDDDAARTLFLTQGSYVRRVYTTKIYTPLAEGDRVPEAALTLAGAKLLALPLRYGRGRVLGLLIE